MQEAIGMDGTDLETKPKYPDADRPTVYLEGLEFQDFIADLLCAELGIVITNYCSSKYQFEHGENRQGIEIKIDNRILETGNVSIEIAEKSSENINVWTPSGIMREDNAWLYVQGNTSIVFIFGKAQLRRLYKHKYQNKVWQPKPTIKTFLIPMKEAELIALKVIRLRKQEDNNQIKQEQEDCNFLDDYPIASSYIKTQQVNETIADQGALFE